MKTFFKSLAFASAALAGFLMTSCNPEEIDTTFEPTAAQATITVTVLDGVTGDDVTASSTIAATKDVNDVEVKGNQVIVTGNYDIKKQVVTITATNAGVTSKPVSVPVNQLLAGGQADYVAVCLVGSPVVADSYTYEENGKPVLSVVKTSQFNPTHVQGYSHDYSHATTGHGEGMGIWAYNESEFVLETTITYPSYTGIQVRNIKFEDACVETEKAVVSTFAEPFEQGLDETEEKLNVKVSAWAMYSAWGTVCESAQNYIVYRVVDEKKVAIASFDVVSTSTAAEYVEAAMPGHDGHYTHGHGHTDIHGAGNNAGGGIVWAD